MIFRNLSEHIDTLTGAWGAMERINATPLPFAYVVHLRTFLVRVRVRVRVRVGVRVGVRARAGVVASTSTR